MSKANIYSITGKKVGEMSLPKEFSSEVNMALLAQAVRVYQDLLHRGRSKTKTRGEVSLSTRKIYRQKGTGLARHGAKSAPIFVGGGKAHGPKVERRVLELPVIMKKKSLNVALSLKASKSKILVIENISKIDKTKKASELVRAIIKDTPEKITSILLVLSGKNMDKQIYFRNIQNINTINYKDLNAYLAYINSLILIDGETFKSEDKKVTKKEVKK